jgi:hypothetical protein
VKHPVVRKRGEQGFALLIVFLMAAAIALMLYQQMPRVAFESERDKEQLLIDRGEQYKRAIQLYVVTNKRYPAKIEDLENTNDKRFLRKRYVDPFTGKNEWRLVHTNGAMLTDSLVQKPPTPDGKTAGDFNASNTSTTPDPNANPAAQVNAAVFLRPSDRTLPTGVPGQNSGLQPSVDPNQNQQFPPITLNPAFPPINLGPVGPNGQPLTGQPGQVPNGPNQNKLPTGQMGQPGQFNPDPSLGQLPGQGGQYPIQAGGGQFPGQTQSGQFQPGQFFQPGQVQQGQVQPTFQPGQIPGALQGQLPNGQAGQTPFPGAGPPGGSNSNAINLINQILTQPSQPPAGLGAPQQNNTIGAGIAGVASTYKAPSVKAYNTRLKFEEWEFVFQNQQTVAAPGSNSPAVNPGNTGSTKPPDPGSFGQTGFGGAQPFGGTQPGPGSGR